MKDNFDNIIKNDRLLYKYVRGSHLYGLETKNSDIDYGGLFFADKNDFLGLSFNYSPQVSDAKNDETWYEIGRFCELLLKSNSTILEALFVPEDKMVVKPNPIIMPLFENRDKFITKDCFKPFVSYAIEQIKKARGLNKKIVNPILERKWPLDFCYTFKAQGSTPVKYWLEYRNLSQEYCGLVNIPNMHDIYGVYYDWGKFFEDEGITSDELISLYGVRFVYDDTPHCVEGLKNAKTDEERRIYSEGLKMCYKVNMINFIVDFYELYNWVDVDEAIKDWYEKNKKPIGYRGIVNPNSNEIRLSSVSKGEKPICYLSYNENGYTKHCVDYKNYQDWVKVRNPKRYESNLHKNYDSKSICHSMRLITMGCELAEGKGLLLDRNEVGDRDFLMKIRNHQFEYDELMEFVIKKQNEMNEAMKTSTLPEHIDVDLVNDILIDIRKNLYKL